MTEVTIYRTNQLITGICICLRSLCFSWLQQSKDEERFLNYSLVWSSSVFRLVICTVSKSHSKGSLACVAGVRRGWGWGNVRAQECEEHASSRDRIAPLPLLAPSNGCHAGLRLSSNRVIHRGSLDTQACALRTECSG